MSATDREILERAALALCADRKRRLDRVPMTLYDESVIDAGVLITAVGHLLEERALANAPDGTHCRSCCYLQAPCDEHKGGKL